MNRKGRYVSPILAPDQRTIIPLPNRPIRSEAEKLSSPRSLIDPAGLRRFEFSISEMMRLSFRALSSVERVRIAFSK